MQFFSCTIDLSWVFNDDGSRAWYALHESRSSTSYLEFHAKRIIQARFQAVLRITSSMFFFYGWQICDKQSPMDHFNVHKTVQLTQVNHEGDIKCDGHENCVYDSTFHHESNRISTDNACYVLSPQRPSHKTSCSGDRILLLYSARIESNWTSGRQQSGFKI